MEDDKATGVHMHESTCLVIGCLQLCVQVRHRFDVINGLLIPGGGANLSPGHKFYDTANLLVRTQGVRRVGG